MKPDIDKNAIAMTQQAIDHVYTMLTERGHGIGLRLGVKTLGCSGYAYNIGFLDKTESNDKIFEINNDITIAVDKNAYPLIKGTVIDFISEGLSRQFKFTNPNVKDLCGCGESFSV
jgi:iron-sulfur cluster assembly protein